MILGLTSVTRRRFAAGSRGSDGRWDAGASTDSTIQMSVQPLSGHELATLPEGERSSVNLKGYTEADVRTLDQVDGEAADHIIIASGPYAGTYEARADNGQTALLTHKRIRLLRVLEEDA